MPEIKINRKQEKAALKILAKLDAQYIKLGHCLPETYRKEVQKVANKNPAWGEPVIKAIQSTVLLNLMERGIIEV
ncbi:hypothetical protein [Endozoicomonas acroporae]|uniref:hypothetical protein n=1 Tax=Endozoicomonas acroporae TaxID=1701104 RepID=UPI003D78D9B6